SGRLELQLHQFLELARAEAGMVGEARERVELGALVRGVVDSIASDVRFATIRFAVEIVGDDDAIDGVPARLETAVRNLVENAASFATADVRARVRVEPDTVIVSVEDDGPGIAAEDLP